MSSREAWPNKLVTSVPPEPTSSGPRLRQDSVSHGRAAPERPPSLRIEPRVLEEQVLRALHDTRDKSKATMALADRYPSADLERVLEEMFKKGGLSSYEDRLSAYTFYQNLQESSEGGPLYVPTAKDLEMKLALGLRELIAPVRVRPSYFSTYHFLESAADLLSKYPKETVESVVEKTIRDPRCSLAAKQGILRLAHLSPDECREFLREQYATLDRKQELATLKRAEKENDPILEIFDDEYEDEGEENAPAVGLPATVFERPLFLSPASKAKQLAEEIQALYGHSPEVLESHPSLATWSKDKKPGIKDRVFGFFRKITGTAVDPDFEQKMDAWRMAKLEAQERPVAARSMATRQPMGVLARRAGPLDTSRNAFEMASSRRGALETTGAYSAAEVRSYTPAEMLRPLAQDIVKIEAVFLAFAKIPEAKMGFDTKRKLKRDIDEVYHRLDQYRETLGQTPAFEKVMQRLRGLYVMYTGLESQR